MTSSQSTFRLGLICISIAANSLVAGGVFVFPIMSPAFAHLLKLTQPQLTTVALAGIMGQYPTAPIVGKILDKYGPSRCSLISAVLFFTAFASSSVLVAITPADIVNPSPWSFRCLTVAFLLAGIATVFSYFSSIFAASKNFPGHPGAAAGTSMALFGLSPLCLSLFADWFTETASGQLRILPYLRFLTVLTTVTHVMGAFILDSRKPVVHHTLGEPDETTRLVSPSSHDEPPSGTYPNPFRDRYFWMLAVFSLCSIGASEMVISNMGSIVLSLPQDSLPIFSGDISPDAVTATQVKILSISNTVSRLLIGPLADFVSPIASYLPTGSIVYSRKHRISRMVFLTVPTFLLCLSFMWMEIGARSRSSLWVLSIGTGINYGAVFTVLPSIVSSGWGPTDLGRNFGVLTYAPFIGTPIFSYLYAFVSTANSGATGICEGTLCWRITFWVTTGTSFLAVLGTVVLWRHWHGRV